MGHECSVSTMGTDSLSDHEDGLGHSVNRRYCSICCSLRLHDLCVRYRSYIFMCNQLLGDKPNLRHHEIGFRPCGELTIDYPR